MKTSEVTMTRALEIGADELMNLAGHALERRPRTLTRVKRTYIAFCLLAYRAIDRAGRPT